MGLLYDYILYDYDYLRFKIWLKTSYLFPTNLKRLPVIHFKVDMLYYALFSSFEAGNQKARPKYKGFKAFFHVERESKKFMAIMSKCHTTLDLRSVYCILYVDLIWLIFSKNYSIFQG